MRAEDVPAPVGAAVRIWICSALRDASAEKSRAIGSIVAAGRSVRCASQRREDGGGRQSRQARQRREGVDDHAAGVAARE